MKAVTTQDRERQRRHRARVRAAQEQTRRKQGYEVCPHCRNWLRIIVRAVPKREKRMIRPSPGVE